MSVSDPTACDADSMGAPTVFTNELLCFMQQKCSLLAFDDLLKLCMDFYTDDEIEEARLLMSKVVPYKRFGKPKGSKKDIANRTLSALLKICLALMQSYPPSVLLI